MLKGARNLSLVVCNYDNQVMCDLYDNQSDVSGQATDVIVRTERNGWKELTFRIPSVCNTAEGIEENYRLQYLIADYRIRLKTDNETDYYLISEPRIVHNGKQKSVEVTAGHISQLLKTKNLNLEFSDDEGNNVGTAEQLLTTILDGTGWSVGEVAEFLEDDETTVKVRSLVASAKTGAFALISDVCEKFDAKPIYHGDTRTVDIVPMNPFAEVEGSEVPEEVLNGKNVLELNYGKNISNITRTLNTENLVTRLYAYGAYGDKTNGLCSLQTVNHTEYIMNLAGTNEQGTEFLFIDNRQDKHYFTVTNTVTNGDTLIWSDMDPVSMSYVWNDTAKCVYKVYGEPETSAYKTVSTTKRTEQNHFDYLMDFSYYEKIGLLTDEMLLALASHQRNMPAIIDESTEAAQSLLNAELELSKVAESNTGFLRLDIGSYSEGANNELVLNIRKSTTYPTGVMYRSDYDEARRNYFSWYCASGLKENGDPIKGIGSVVYIIHKTTPVTWEKAYIKEIDGQAETQDYSLPNAINPSSITLWLSSAKIPTLKSTDRFYLFSTNSISGQLGVRESELESLQQTLDQATKVVTEKHPTYFVWDGDPIPSIESVQNGYGWYYRTFTAGYTGNKGDGGLHFFYGNAGETAWHDVIVSETMPTTVTEGSYFFDFKKKRLYHGESSGWIDVSELSINVSSSQYTAPTAEAMRLSQSFSKVIYYCKRHDMLYEGLYPKYKYTPSAALNTGNYAINSDYGFYWVFSTTQQIPANKSLYIDTEKYLVYQDGDTANIVTPEAKPYESIDFPTNNDLNGIAIFNGDINNSGEDTDSAEWKRTNYISVYGSVVYSYKLAKGSKIAFYDTNRRFIEMRTVASTSANIVTTNIKAKYARIIFEDSLDGYYFCVNDYQNKLFIKDVQYTILQNVVTEGDKSGILTLVKKFADLADECYLTYLTTFTEKQNQIKIADNALKNTLQDLYREGYWQKNEYVEGDESKLYKDTLDNLKKISKPEATYNLQYLDLYSSNEDIGYSVTENLDSVQWPDVDITDAVHLIDEEIDVNCWAFIDVLEKCYDQPWKTQLTINTDLSLIAQHSFTDVLARIADVANETSAKQTIYKRAAAIGSAGTYAANKLEGTIKANKLLFDGGMSNWHTDTKGNIVFESADGQSAMMLTGYGFCVSNSKDSDGDWIWRTFGTGNGFTADEIVAGEMSAVHLIAGTITADKLSSAVGQELEISSNKALSLFATTTGSKPAGSVKTPTVGEEDSYIEIAAKQGDNPAHISIMTGGYLEVAADSLRFTSTGKSYNDHLKEEVVETVRVYRRHNSDKGTGPVLEQNPAGTGNDTNWTVDIPEATSSFPYLWGRTRKEYRDNTYSFSDATYEENLTKKIKRTYNEYCYTVNKNNASANPDDSTNWFTDIPKVDLTKNTLWWRLVTEYTNGTISYGVSNKITDTTKLSDPLVRAYYIANGYEAVPYVDATGIEIKDGKIKISSQAGLEILDNASIYLGTDSSNSAMVLDKNGIAIGSGGHIAIASDGDLLLSASSLKFLVDPTAPKEEDKYKNIDELYGNQATEYVKVYYRSSWGNTSTSKRPPVPREEPTGDEDPPVSTVTTSDSDWTTYIPEVPKNTNRYFLWSTIRHKDDDGNYTYNIPPVYEESLNTKVIRTYKEYCITKDKSSTDGEGNIEYNASEPTNNTSWSETIPTKTGEHYTIWWRLVTVYEGGRTETTVAQQDTELTRLSNAAITAVNISNGTIGVPHVKSDGITISNGNVSITSTANLTVAANKELRIGTNGVVPNSNDNAIIFNDNGISIGSGKSVAIAASQLTFVTTGSNTNKTYQQYLNEEIVETVRVYKINNISPEDVTSGAEARPVADSGWEQLVPSVTSTNKYLWSALRYKPRVGSYTYSTAYCETGLKDLSDKAIQAMNIANGTIGVPHVTTTGIDMNETSITLTATSDLLVSANNSLRIGTSSDIADNATNNAIIFDENGISVGSSKRIAIAANKLEFITGNSSKAYQDYLNEEIIETTRVYYRHRYYTDSYKPDRPKYNGTSVAYGTWIDAADPNWSEIVPPASTDNYNNENYRDLKYIWSILRYKRKDGKYSYGETMKYEKDLSEAANIASGRQSVPYVETTAIQMQNDSIYVKATANLTFAANQQIFIGTNTANNAIILNNSGITIGSGKRISILSGGTVLIGTSGHAFGIASKDIEADPENDIPEDKRAYIYKGKTSLNSDTVDGIYLGTDGIALGKGTFKVTSAGEITSTSGKIGGWTLGSKWIMNDDKHVGMYSGTNTDRVFWAGGERLNANNNGVPPDFFVRADGYLYAQNAAIEGNIKAKTLQIEYTKANDTKSFSTIALDNTGHIQLSSIENGANLASFSVGSNNVKTLVWDASANNASQVEITSAGIYLGSTGTGTSKASVVEITPTGIKLGTTGTFEVASEKFGIDSNGNVSMTGTIIATSGQIGVTIDNDGVASGGWTISENQIYSGSGASYVCLNSNITQQTGNSTFVQPYAMWVGAESASSAPFRVMRDGTVILTKLAVQNENGTGYSTVNLYGNNSDYRISKLKEQVGALESNSVTGISSSVSGTQVTITLTTSGGSYSTNFNKPGVGTVRLNGGGSANFTAEAFEQGVDINTNPTAASSCTGYMFLSSTSYSRSTTANVGTSSNSGTVATLSLTDYWDAAKSAGESAVKNGLTLTVTLDGPRNTAQGVAYASATARVTYNGSQIAYDVKSATANCSSWS